MLALEIIGGLLLFLFLLTLLPVRAEVAFQEEFILTLRYLFLTFRILPGKEEEPEQEEESKKEKEQQKQEEQKKESALRKLKPILKRRGFTGFLKSLFELIKMAASSSKRLLSHFKVKSFDLYLCVGGAGDAGEAALRYGQLSGAVYSVCGFFFGLVNCPKKAVTVDLDYNVQESRVDFSAKLSVLPLFVLREGLSLLIKGLPVFKELLGNGARSKNHI